MTENLSGKAERDPAPRNLEPEENSRFPTIPGMRFPPAPVPGADDPWNSKDGGSSRKALPSMAGNLAYINTFGFQAVANACRQFRWLASPRGTGRFYTLRRAPRRRAA